MARRKIIVIGAGGLAREIAWLIRDIDGIELAGHVVSDLSQRSRSGRDETILGDFDWLRAHRHEYSALTLGIGAPDARLRLAAELADFDEEWWPPVVSPAARLDRKSCRVAHGTILCAGSIATVEVTLAAFSLVNLNCTIGHGATIGEGSALNPGVNVSGGVGIGRGVMIGTGAQVLEYLTIGDGATIGAGAVITKNVGAGETIVSPPAFRLKTEWKES